MLTRTREKFLLFLYFISMVLSLLLCYYSGIYCHYLNCWALWFTKNHHYPQEQVQIIKNTEDKIREESENDSANNYKTFELFVMCMALLILLLSLIWLLANSMFKKSEIRATYSRFEMPTAVICSLLAGICAVTEFHHSIDYSFLRSSEKWTFAGIDATALSLLHAIIAFALH